MSTKFFSKKMTWSAFIVALAVLVGSLSYAGMLAGAKELAYESGYYFLVSKDVKIEVGAQFAQLDGGAGYILSHGQAEYVALSVYATEEDGIAVQERLGEETQLVYKGVHSLYFKGSEKANAQGYVAALRTLGSYVLVLENCVSRLEGGMTQESCKRLLELLQRQFMQAEKTFKGYEEFTEVCKTASEELGRLCGQTVLLKDLRYLLCSLAEKHVQLCSAFAL